MNYISVNRALTVGWFLIALVAAAAMGVAFAIMVMADNRWPLYISLPLALVLPIATMIGLFALAAHAWIGWAYLRVADVKELQQASQLSGFGWYSPFHVKNGRKLEEIRERFKKYEFIDDPNVPQRLEIYHKKPYRNGKFMFGAGLTVFFIALLATGNATRSAGILPIVMGAITFVIYYKSSDRSPQLTLSDKGIEADGNFYDWPNISRWELRQGKTSDVAFVHAGIEKRIEVDNLTTGNRRLNHLLYVYSQRGKSGSAERGAVHRPGVVGYRPQG